MSLDELFQKINLLMIKVENGRDPEHHSTAAPVRSYYKKHMTASAFGALLIGQ